MNRRTTKLRSSSKEKHSLIWKVGLIAALVIFSIWKLIPSIQYYTLSDTEMTGMDPGKLDKIRNKAINLGLDLQGGIHLVMQVDTSGMEGDTANDAVERVKTVITNRVDQFGLVEPIVQRQGTNRIIIELPGMKDVERAKNLIGKTARLEFRLLKSDEDIQFITDKIDLHLSGVRDTTAVKDSTAVGLFDEQTKAAEESKKFTQLLRFQRTGGVPSFDMLVEEDNIPRVEAILGEPEVKSILNNARVIFLWGPENERTDNYRVLYLANAASEMTGEMIKDARVSTGSGMEAGRFEVNVENTSDGVREWARITGANIGKRLAIDLDNTVYSAPEIKDKIYGGSSRISGSFTQDESRDLAIVLRAGALPASVNIIEDRTVGPSLGADSMRDSKIALIVGTALVILFMVFYYTGAGVIAVVGVILDILFILAYLAYFRATLTLPGIAGIILTIGMAVDANVLINERIREEMRIGNTTRGAVANGFLKARWTILDSNITTILTAIILYNFGTGPIKGFALTLMVGLVASVFTALFVSKVIFDIITHKINLTRGFNGYLEMFIDTKFKFVEFRRKAYIFSGALILAGIVSLIIHAGPKYSIDFLGGTLLELHFDKPVTISEVRDTLSKVDVPGTDLATSEIKFVGKENQDILIRIVKVGNMEETTSAVKTALQNRFTDSLPSDTNTWVLREEQVGPSIGADLRNQAFWAILWSLVVMVIYIAIRFEFKYSIGAILSLTHDVMVTIGIFSILGKEISLTIVAALLTIVGYSVNDTIVIFDRIREKLRTGAREGYFETLNNAINQTLSRTVITSLTTLLAVIAIYIFGGSVIHDFAFAMLLGVIFGSYSTIFIAAPLLVEWYLAFTQKQTVKR